jgi:hypothetical protein
MLREYPVPEKLGFRLPDDHELPLAPWLRS